MSAEQEAELQKLSEQLVVVEAELLLAAWAYREGQVGHRAGLRQVKKLANDKIVLQAEIDRLRRK